MQNAARRREKRRIGVFLSLNQIRKNHGGRHGCCHTPFLKSGCNIQIRRSLAVLTNIGHSIQSHTILGCPFGCDWCLGIVLLRNRLRQIPPCACLSGTVSPTAEEKPLPIPSNRQSIFRTIQLHPIYGFLRLQGHHIGALLV